MLQSDLREQRDSGMYSAGTSTVVKESENYRWKKCRGNGKQKCRETNVQGRGETKVQGREETKVQGSGETKVREKGEAKARLPALLQVQLLFFALHHIKPWKVQHAPGPLSVITHITHRPSPA